MNSNFQRLMQEATRLTRSRDLMGATAVIQAALQSAGLQKSPVQQHTGRDDIVVDVDAHEVHAEAHTAATRAIALDARPADAPAVLEGDTVTSGHSQGRDWQLYIPPHRAGQKLALVVMLHGCTQSPGDFAAGTRMNDAAREQGCFVLYPAQSSKANPQRCWNWFKHTHQARGRGEAAMLANMTLEIIERYPIDPARVYVAGLSAGGAMAAILADAYPDIYAAAGVHSGLAAGSAQDLSSALGAMQKGGTPVAHKATARPTIVFHGDADTTVHPRNGEQVIAATTGPSARTESSTGRSTGGRRYTRAVHKASDGRVVAEHWVVHSSGHAWSGGSPAGSYTDTSGPDATAEMLRFFLEHPRRS
ncbi:alpha/beta hydrolase family esterase [Caenimonas koreensis]|uniref:extracellular catalytic domain type 1 short-chain-length polyhydroxyalkanoate depolymerase n=1 Tax=Caenimonas koreensis TaxID=367474 RepID=UPI0037852A39